MQSAPFTYTAGGNKLLSATFKRLNQIHEIIYSVYFNRRHDLIFGVFQKDCRGKASCSSGTSEKDHRPRTGQESDWLSISRSLCARAGQEIWQRIVCRFVPGIVDFVK
jgi:hypothetical protein